MERKKDLKKLFPHLVKELEGSENKVKIDALRKDPTEIEEGTAVDVEVDETEAAIAETVEEESPEIKPDKFRHYNPDVVDFLRRCDTAAQAEEIIAYLCKKGELTEETACQIRAQLKKEGVRSFGPKKENDYYFRQSGI